MRVGRGRERGLGGWRRRGTHVNGALKLARGGAKGVEHEVLGGAVDEAAARAQRRRHQRAALLLAPPARERAHDLALHVHDHHRVGAVAHHEVVRVLGREQQRVDGRLAAAERLERGRALARAHRPHLHAAVRRAAQHRVPIWGEHRLVHERPVTSELFQHLARLEPVDPVARKLVSDSSGESAAPCDR